MTKTVVLLGCSKNIIAEARMTDTLKWGIKTKRCIGMIVSFHGVSGMAFFEEEQLLLPFLIGDYLDCLKESDSREVYYVSHELVFLDRYPGTPSQKTMIVADITDLPTGDQTVLRWTLHRLRLV